jgi:hypothetical protein
VPLKDTTFQEHNYSFAYLSIILEYRQKFIGLYLTIASKQVTEPKGRWLRKW